MELKPGQGREVAQVPAVSDDLIPGGRLAQKILLKITSKEFSKFNTVLKEVLRGLKLLFWRKVLL